MFYARKDIPNLNCLFGTHYATSKYDFEVEIYICNFNYFRQRLETDLIKMFNTTFPCGLNSVFSDTLKSLDNYIKPPLHKIT